MWYNLKPWVSDTWYEKKKFRVTVKIILYNLYSYYLKFILIFDEKIPYVKFQLVKET